MKVIIAGGRKFNDYSLLSSVCDYMLQNQHYIEIISGTAKGADKLGEKYAEERGYKIIPFPADWQLYGKAAGYKRNQLMAQNADALICFWDGVSKGSKHMIDLAEKEGLKVKIVMYEK